MSRIALWLGLGLALSVWPAQAEKSSDFFKSYQGYNDDGKAFLDKIEPKIGTVDLAEGVHLTLGDKFYFLNKKDTASVLTEAWGNPASSAADSVGMIFPAKYDPIADGNWGIELRWRR